MKNSYKKGNVSKKGFYATLLFMFLLSFSSGFAQSTLASTTNDDIVNSLSSDSKIDNTVVTENSNSNFILWFMGTKEAPNKDVSKDGFYTKKQIISSGTVPNHLLMRTLLKKTVNTKFC